MRRTVTKRIANRNYMETLMNLQRDSRAQKGTADKINGRIACQFCFLYRKTGPPQAECNYQQMIMSLPRFNEHGLGNAINSTSLTGPTPTSSWYGSANITLSSPTESTATERYRQQRGSKQLHCIRSGFHHLVKLRPASAYYSLTMRWKTPLTWIRLCTQVSHIYSTAKQLGLDNELYPK